jgi:hypothetical protein
MRLRTPPCEVFWALLLNPKHSGVLKDSKSPTLGVLGFTPTLGQSGVATGLHKEPMSIKGVAAHHTGGSVEWEKALHFTHACVWMHCVCHGAG